MLSRSDVGDEQELSEIEKKVLDGDSTWVPHSLDGPECKIHDTEPATTPGHGEWYNAITHLWNLSALKLANAMLWSYLKLLVLFFQQEFFRKYLRLQLV